MPGPFHQWMMIKDRNGGLYEVFNAARTAHYLSSGAFEINGVSPCDILDFGGCETYPYAPSCESEGGYIDAVSTAGNSITIPDQPALDITGDLTLIAWLTRPDWTPGASATIFGRGTNYRMRINTSGQPFLEWTDNAAGSHTETIATPLPVIDGSPIWMAMDIDVNDGAGQHIVRAWVSSDGINWVQHGADNVNAGTTTFQAVSTQLFLTSSSTSDLENADVAHVEVRAGRIVNGLATGTVIFEFDGEADLVGVAPGAASFVASSGQTVTVNHTGGTPAALVPFLDGNEWVAEIYDTPATDPAPWYNAAYPESADALGFYIDEWTGLDDKHVVRTATPFGGQGGGVTLNAATAGQRTMAINLILIGETEEAVEYLFRWLAASLTGVCSSCASDSILIRRFCGSEANPEYGVAELRNVGLTRGLGWETDDFTAWGNCQIRRASVILTAGDPCMYLPATDVPLVATDVNADLVACFQGTDINPDRAICRPSCSELIADCRVIRTFEVSPMAAIAPVVVFENNQSAYAFPFRAVVYADPHELGATPNPCGLNILGEIYVRALPPFSTLVWDVAGRDVTFRNVNTGVAQSTWGYILPNDPPKQRFFALPCSQAHLAIEPATMCVDDLGSDVYEAGGIEFNPPLFPQVTVTLQERVSCA